MSLHDDIELRTTKAKLARLERRYELLRNRPSEDVELRDATLDSLKKYIDQFAAEIAEYEAHLPAQA